MAEVLWLSTVFTLKSKTVAICLLLLPLGRERGLPSERTSSRSASRLMAMPILPSWRLSELIREAATELGSRNSGASDRLAAHLQEVVRERDPYGAPVGHAYVQAYVTQQLAGYGVVTAHEFGHLGRTHQNLVLDLPGQTDPRTGARGGALRCGAGLAGSG